MYLALSLACLAFAIIYGLHRFFNFKHAQLELSKDVYDELLESLRTLTEEMALVRKYEARFDAITKTFLSDIRDAIKFEEKKVQDTQAAAYKAVQGRR